MSIRPARLFLISSFVLALLITVSGGLVTAQDGPTSSDSGDERVSAAAYIFEGSGQWGDVYLADNAAYAGAYCSYEHFTGKHELLMYSVEIHAFGDHVGQPVRLEALAWNDSGELLDTQSWDGVTNPETGSVWLPEGANIWMSIGYEETVTTQLYVTWFDETTSAELGSIGIQIEHYDNIFMGGDYDEDACNFDDYVPNPTMLPGGFAPGTAIFLNAKANLRSGPSTSHSIKGQVSAGSRGTVVGFAMIGSGYAWYPVKMENGATGYLASQFLAAAPTSPTATRTPSPTPTATLSPTITETPTITQTASSTPTRTQTSPATSTPTTIPGGFAPADLVQTTTNVNLRSGPGSGYTVLAVVPMGVQGTVTGYPTVAGGYTWYPVSMNGQPAGYLAGLYLTKTGVASVTPTGTATRTATSTRTSAPPTVTRTATQPLGSTTPTQTGTLPPPTSTRTATRTPTTTPGGLIPGNLVRTTQKVNLRTSPSIGGGVMAIIPANTNAVVLSYPVSSNGYLWYQVSISGHLPGWMAGTYLTKTVSATATPTRTRTPAPRDTATTVPTLATTQPGGFQPGQTIQVNIASLNLRSGPGTTYGSLGVMPRGTTGTVTGAYQLVGTTVWYPVEMAGYGPGWVAGQYLVAVTAAALEPTPEPTTALLPTEVVIAPSVAPTETQVPTQEPTVEELPTTPPIIEEATEVSEESETEATP